jgi:low affinity Fe/Cu permease
MIDTNTWLALFKSILAYALSKFLSKPILFVFAYISIIFYFSCFQNHVTYYNDLDDF